MTRTAADGGPRLSREDVRQVRGDLADWRILAILGVDATAGDLAAVAWLHGEDDIMCEERRPLTGAAAQIYDILTADEESGEEDRRA